jgi:predicted naringenin-chalcone synthase
MKPTSARSDLATLGTGVLRSRMASGKARVAGAARDGEPLLAGQPHPRIAGLALAHPPSTFTQREVLALLGLEGDEFAERIFARCGVERRQLDLTPELLGTTLQGRTTLVEEQLMGYAVRAVEQLQIDPAEIGTIVTGTLYSLGGPTLAHRLIEHFEMDPRTDKYHVLGVGCASAVPLVRLVGQTLADRPDKKGLIVAAESMSGLLVGARAEDTRSKTVGSSIFGDGCGAMLIERDGADGLGGPGPAVLASQVHQVSDTLGAVSMELSAENSYLHIVRELPNVAGENLREIVDRFLRENRLTDETIDHWMIHPGGRRIIEEAQEALSLPDEDVRISFEVLANHGNVGTPSIFYVMHETIEQRVPAPGDIGLVVTIGPGVTVGLMLLRW